jgi:DNA repair photolyase
MSERTVMNGKPVYEVPAKSVINWDSGFKHKLLCDGPTFSTGSACAYSCAFCYVPDIMTKSPHMAQVKEKFEDVVIRRKGALEALDKQLQSKRGRELAEKKIVIYASPLVDVAANMDLVKETIEVCKLILANTDWDIRLLSKSNLLPKIAQGFPFAWVGGEYSNSCTAQDAKERIIYGVSTGTLEDKLAKAFEQGTPFVSKRIESLHWLQDNGYRTFGMVCPSLPQKDYDKFSQEMMAAIRADRCEHVWAEVINVRGESFTRTMKALSDAGYTWEAGALAACCNKDIWEMYARHTFLAHYRALNCYPGKLRFLQYVTKQSREWWDYEQQHGAVLL